MTPRWSPLVILLAWPLVAQAATSGDGPAATLKQAVAAACGADGGLAPPRATDLLPALPGARLLEEDNLYHPNAPFRQGSWRFALADGAELKLVRQLRGDGRAVGVAAEYDEAVPGAAPRPRMAALARGGCNIVLGRMIDYGADGVAESLIHLDGNLKPTGRREPLNPPVPSGDDPGGIAVALFDSGINYTLPLFDSRLARDGEGRLLGYDYWDLDPLPFDSNPARSPFFPMRHGTAVASVLLREAPLARLLPYRFPRPDLTRMADMVADAHDKGATIVAMAMGSAKKGDWIAFLDAATRRPDMLFVISAGNNGRDIDSTPIYPAAADLDNILVVTSAERDGRLARGSNWGRRNVDIMVPAEEMEVVDHRGFTGTASGSSYAVPRIAALAARLQALNPDWRAPELKAAIVERATAAPDQIAPKTRFGWIADPASEG